MFDYFMLLSIAEENITIVLEITPGTQSSYSINFLFWKITGVCLPQSTYTSFVLPTGYSDWHVLIFDTPWFLALNIFFAAAYLGLLGLVIRKFVLKVKRSGFVWNIGFVYLMFQSVFCARKYYP